MSVVGADGHFLNSGVFEGCPAFLDIRMFSGVDMVKWVVTGVSHCHSFDVFPGRMPRNTFPEVLLNIRRMAVDKVNIAEIKLKNDVLCNRNVFQNSLRSVRKAHGCDQCRDLRNTVAA